MMLPSDMISASVPPPTTIWINYTPSPLQRICLWSLPLPTRLPARRYLHDNPAVATVPCFPPSQQCLASRRRNTTRRAALNTPLRRTSSRTRDSTFAASRPPVSPAAHVHGQQQSHATAIFNSTRRPPIVLLPTFRICLSVCFGSFGSVVHVPCLVEYLRRPVPLRALSCTLNPQTAGAWLVPPPAPCFCDFGVLRKTKSKYHVSEVKCTPPG